MELGKQVCSLELAKRLKELGVKQESLFIWIGEQPEKKGQKEHYDVYRKDNWNTDALYDWVAAYTVAELGEMLVQVEVEGEWYVPVSYRFTNDPPSYECELLHRKMLKSSLHKTVSFSEADARAKMLIYLIENGLLDVKTLNV